MNTATLYEKPASGLTSGQTVLCACDGGQARTLILTVLESTHVHCPKCSRVLVFCEHCGHFTSSRSGRENPLVEFGSTHTWDCIGCGEMKSGG